MNWYAAHVVMAVEFKDAPQEHFPVWENILLIEARTEEEALSKADKVGRAEEGDDDGTFRWGKRRARWIFAGVRKLTLCVSATERPGDLTEISYNELDFESRQAVEAFVAGRPVAVRYNDRYRNSSDKTRARNDASKPRKRRPA